MDNIILDSESFKGNYDESNPLVLPSQKKLTKIKKQSKAPLPKILSRSKRKELQRQVAKKEKKLSRNELWKELGSVYGYDAKTASTDKLFSRNRSKQRKLDKIADISKQKLSNKWRVDELSNASHSSVDTDDFSSSEEVEPDRTESSSLNDKVHLLERESSSKVLEVNKMDKKDIRPVEEPEIPVVNSDLGIATYVLVNRSPAIQTARLALPVVAEEVRIMEQIKENDVVLICGATGSGKTTQIPQFLYEAGYTRDGYKIGITEPRRVAAISMSQRVSVELGLKTGEVAYHIRYEKNTDANTKIKFMTDGILLQEMKKDFQLSAYSAILIDEAHERSVYTDILLGLLSLVIRLRRKAYDKDPKNARLPLKLIIMSATMRVEDFANNRQLFPTLKAPGKDGNGSNSCLECNSDEEESVDNAKTTRPGAPPIIKIESRQYPVTCHFSRVTPQDYLKAAFRKVITIHKGSPPGGILVFLTGQREVKTLCSWLSTAFPAPKTDKTSDKITEEVPVARMSGARRRKLAKELMSAAEAKQKEGSEAKKPRTVINIDNTDHDSLSEGEEIEMPSTSRFNLDNFAIIPADEETEVGLGCEIKARSSNTSNTNEKKTNVGSDIDDDEQKADEEVLDDEVLRALDEMKKLTPVDPIHALPLYSLLPVEQQSRVFEAPPEGHRLVVVATNVAETSLTIPNIRYVVDTGKVKSKIYDTGTGSSCFRIVWISQASAEQRAGRAGRIGPGHCYRLYPSKIYADEMEPFSAPDILTRPIDEVVLLLKSYLGSTPLFRFPLPTPPTPNSVEAAERRLTALGALEAKKQGSDIIRTITPAGRWMSQLPLSTRFARMLLFANQYGLMPYAVVLVASLSVQDFFLNDQSPGEEAEAQKAAVPEDLSMIGRKRKKAQLSEADAIAQARLNFLRQFLKTESDLMLGDLAVLLGAFCCFERYWAELIGTIPHSEESGISEQIARVARLNPESIMRQLVQKCGVRWKAYIEVRQLRQQLTQILNANIPDLNLEIDPALPKPTFVQVEQLRQLFLVGSVCHLAAKYDLPAEGLPAKDRRRLKYAYKVLGIQEPVFIDTTSPLARENCSFVAFTELHTSSKPYLRNVCAINPAWVPFLAPRSYRVEGVCTTESSETVLSSEVTTPQLVSSTEEDAKNRNPQAKPSSPNECPPPFYDPKHDTVLAYAKRVYFIGADLVEINDPGVETGLELPALHTPFPLTGEASCTALGDREALIWSVRWFARALLEGNVYPDKKQLGNWFPKELNTSMHPRIITRSWGLGRAEVKGLVKKMLSKKVNSKCSLEACLAEDPTFLSNELAAWLSPSRHADFFAKWPPTKA
nr:ATP dependent RNA helicase DHX37 [Hymenolepis microstoma]